MPSTQPEPEPEWRVPYTETPPADPAPTADTFRLPYSSEPQPYVFGKKPAPPAAPAWQQPQPGLTPTGWQQPGPYQLAPRPQGQLPSIGIIWLNILLFGWFLGLGLIYGVIKSIQGIARSRNRGLSPIKYVIPLIAIAAVFLLLVIIGASIGHNQPSTGPSAFGN